jgi:hypothetical protein
MQLRRSNAIAVAAILVAGPLASPATAAAPAAAAAVAAAAPPPAHAPSAIRGDNVLIEGKLYSPQALFIVSRRSESFGRDAIVPQYLDVRPDAAFLPYRLRSDRMSAADASTADSSAATSTTQ